MKNEFNSPEYWDTVYKNERGSGKRRIDNERLQYVINTMKTYDDAHPHDKPHSFLDVGCGNGEMMRLVHADLPDWRMYGVDITRETIDWAMTVDLGFKYTLGTAYELNFGEIFDVVFCGETLEHLEDPTTAIYQMLKVIKPGGVLVCSVPNEGNNRSPEHIQEFTVFDALKMTTDGDMSKLVDVSVKCNGISTIWTTLK